MYWLRLRCPQPSKSVASVLTYTFRECLVCFVMLDWSSEDMIQFSLYYLWCPIRGVIDQGLHLSLQKYVNW